MSVFDIFKKLDESRKVQGPVEYIVAGLGNPGKQYEATRHNAGFLAVDYIAGQCGVKINRSKFEALVCDGQIEGKHVLFIKPLTYMNSSGTAIVAAADFYKVPADKIIVLCDDISLDPGTIRVRREGSAGGHNGLKSINQWLATEKYPRIKIGVGAKPTPEYDLADWVLSKMSEEDSRLMKDRYPDIMEGLKHIISGDIEKAMQICN